MTELLQRLRASTAACLAARRVQRAWLAPCRSRQACGHERLGAVSTDLATAHTRFDQEGRPYLSLLPHASGPCRHRCCLFSHSFQHRSRSGRSTLKSSHKSRRLNSLVTNTLNVECDKPRKSFPRPCYLPIYVRRTATRVALVPFKYVHMIAKGQMKNSGKL